MQEARSWMMLALCLISLALLALKLASGDNELTIGCLLMATILIICATIVLLGRLLS